MPLIHSASKAALAQNMHTLHEDIGKSPHVQSHEQAVAIALHTQDEARKGHKPKRKRRFGSLAT